MNVKSEILKLTSTNEPISFFLWVKLLTFFEKHKEQLDLEDIKIIVDKCEECRLYLNENSSTYIKQEETVPNVYEYLENIIKINA